LANQRQGTKSCKTRAEVRGGGRKPWKQKGTGHARQGSIRSPQWRGGGVVFAPKPRDFRIKLNKKLKRLALKSVFSQKFLEKKIILIDDFKLKEIKTKFMKKILDNLNINNALLAYDNNKSEIFLSSRNIKNIKSREARFLNVYEILKFDNLVLTLCAVKKIEEMFGVGA
jgi:large subunit ribosomal protein L4